MVVLALVKSVAARAVNFSVTSGTVYSRVLSDGMRHN